MLRCLLVDDELLSLKYLQLLLEETPEVEVVKSFNDPEILMQQMADLNFDFCILDIEMPKMSGLQLAEQLVDVPIVFVTAYKAFAFDAFELNAVDYLAKPIKLERLIQAIDKVKQRLLKQALLQNTKVEFHSDRGKVMINILEILQITSSTIDSRDKILYLIDQSEITLKNITFNKLLAILPEKDFMRVNKKDIINFNFVHLYTNDSIMLKSENSERNIALSEYYRSEFLAKISN